jgi:predicted nucleotidyltransferase
MIVKNVDIHNAIIKQVHIKLKEILRGQYELFIKYITVNDIAISGSFIMQCILGEDWEESDIDLYLFDEENDNYFDVMGIDKEVLTYEQKKEIMDSYGNFIDIRKIINRKIYDKKIQAIYVPTQTRNEFKSFVLDNFDLNICKNIFQIVDGKEMVYVHDLTGLINRREVVDGNYMRDKKKGRIEKYKSRGFDISGELTIDKYFKYSINSMPFLVFKNDKDGKLEKLTFLDKVMNRDDVIKCLEGRDGNIIIHVDNDKCEKIKERWIFGIYLKELFEMFLEGGQIQQNMDCNCHLDNICGIKHYDWAIDICRIHSNDKFIKRFLIVNYDDLNDVMKSEYNKVFEMGCNICDDFANVENKCLNGIFWKKYMEFLDVNKWNDGRTYNVCTKYFNTYNCVKKTLDEMNDDDYIYTKTKKRYEKSYKGPKKEGTFQTKQQFISKQIGKMKLLDMDVCYKVMTELREYFTEHGGHWCRSQTCNHHLCLIDKI